MWAFQIYLDMQLAIFLTQLLMFQLVAAPQPSLFRVLRASGEGPGR